MKFVKATSIAVVIFCTITSFFFLENGGAIKPVLDNTNDTSAFENDKASGEYLNPQMNRKKGLVDTIIPINKINYVNCGNFCDIEFISSSGKKTKFDVLEHNPYNQLDFSILRKNEWSCNVYDVSQIDLTDETKHYLLAPNDWDRFKDRDIVAIESDASVYNKGKDFTIAYYNILSYVDQQTPIGNRGTALILNNRGEVIRKFDHLDVEIWSPAITEDGKFFTFKYGQRFEDDWQIIYQGFRIYEMETGEMIYEENAIEPLESFCSMGINQFNLIQTCRYHMNKRGSSIKIVINPYTRTYYYQSMKQLNRLAEKFNQFKTTWEDIVQLEGNREGYKIKNIATGEIMNIKYETHYNKINF